MTVRFDRCLSASLTLLALVVLSACGPGHPSPSASPTAPPDTAACDDNTVGQASPTPTAESTPTDTPPDAPDAEYPQKQIPDGVWTGPIVVSTTGTPTRAGGTVYNPGGGEINLTIKDHKVTGGSGTFTASSSGTVTIQGASATVSGSGTMSDGVATGTASRPELTGTFVQSGSMTVTEYGHATTVPINGTPGITITLTVTEVSCMHVVASIIPDLDAKAAGSASFTGTAEWDGERAHN